MDSSDFKKEAVDLEEAFFAKENTRLLKELRIRTLETELAARVRRKRAEERERRLDIELEQ